MESIKVGIIVRNLENQDLANLSLDDVVYCHLSTRSPELTKDYKVYTTLELVELEMRQSRARQNTANYAPLLTGFALLDQIGGCYEDNAKPLHPSGGSAIERALYYFMGYSPRGPEVQAIYALRNGMVHEGSLTCKTKSQAHYIFRYDSSLTSAIKLAPTPWNGQAATLGTRTTTLVNPRVLTDDISIAIDALRDCYFHRRADLKILKTREEIIHNYLIWQLRNWP